MQTDPIKKRQDLITQLMHADHFYGTMYGMHKSKDTVIKISTKDIHSLCLIGATKGQQLYIYGVGPGPVPMEMFILWTIMEKLGHFPKRN